MQRSLVHHDRPLVLYVEDTINRDSLPYHIFKEIISNLEEEMIFAEAPLIKISHNELLKPLITIFNFESLD